MHHIELGRHFTRRFPKRDRLTIVLITHCWPGFHRFPISTHSRNGRNQQTMKITETKEKKERERKISKRKRVSWLLNNCCCRCLPGSVRIYEHHKGSHPSLARCRDDVQAHTTPLLIVWLADSHNHSTLLSLYTHTHTREKDGRSHNQSIFKRGKNTAVRSSKWRCIRPFFSSSSFSFQCRC